MIYYCNRAAKANNWFPVRYNCGLAVLKFEEVCVNQWLLNLIDVSADVLNPLSGATFAGTKHTDSDRGRADTGQCVVCIVSLGTIRARLPPVRELLKVTGRSQVAVTRGLVPSVIGVSKSVLFTVNTNQTKTDYLSLLCPTALVRRQSAATNVTRRKSRRQ